MPPAPPRPDRHPHRSSGERLIFHDRTNYGKLNFGSNRKLRKFSNRILHPDKLFKPGLEKNHETSNIMTSLHITNWPNLPCKNFKTLHSGKMKRLLRVNLFCRLGT